MAKDLGTLYYQVKADTDDLKEAEARMDQFGSGARKAGKDIDKLGDDTKSATKKMEDGFGSAKKEVVKFIGAYVGFTAVKSALTGVISATADFNKSISNLSAITGATGKDLQFYSDQAKEIGRTTSLSASQAAEAFKLIASAKPDLLSSAASLAAVTREAVTLAEAASISLPEAANALGNSLNQFSAGADQASRFINVLAAGAKFGASSIADTAMALKASGAAANAAGLSFESTNAGIQALAAGGISAAVAGTGLRNVLLILEQASDENLRPSVVGLAGAIQNLSDKNLTLTETTDMFGRESAIAALTLVEQSASLAGLTENLTGTNTATEQAATNLDNLAGDALASKSAFEALQIAIGERFDPSLRSATQSATAFTVSLAEFAGSEQFSKVIANASDLVTALGVTLSVVATVHLVRLVAQINLATAAQLLLNRAVAINPYVAAGVALTALTYAILSYTRESREAAKETRSLMESTLDLLETIELNKVKVTSLDEAMRNVVLSHVENIKAVDKSSEAIKISTARTAEQMEALRKSAVALDHGTFSTKAQKSAVDAMVASLSYVPTTYMDVIARGNETAFVMQGVTAAVKTQTAAIDFWSKVSEAGAKRRTAAEEVAARNIEQNYQRTHEYVTNIIIDFAENGGSAFERIGDVAVATAKRIAAEWLALKALNLFGISSPSGGGGSAAGSIGGGVASAVIGKGISAIGTAAQAGYATGGMGSAVSAGASAVGSAAAGIGSKALAFATNPVTLAIVAAIAAAKLLETKTTPSGNAGLLINDAPGAPADQKFSVAPFASGFAPIGFARREDQAAAVGVIDIYRQYDAALTGLANAAGLSVNYSNNPFGGYDEKGQGNGVFLGVASESGNPVGAKVEDQLTQFVGQWIDALGNQITPEERSMIKSAGSADAMIAAAQGLVGKIDGSHATGLSRVPFDGYIAQLHQGEEVLRSNDPRNANNGGMEGLAGTMKLETMKKINKLLSILERWDFNGLPETRVL